MSGIFGPSNSGLPRFDFSVLGDYYLAKSQLASSATARRTTERSEAVRVEPWAQTSTPPTSVTRLKEALTAKSFVDLRVPAFETPGVASDHRKLFALYKGLSHLQALAARAGQSDIQDGERASLNRRYAAGLAEIKSFVGLKNFEDLTMGFGEKLNAVDSGFRKARPPTLYAGPTIATGSPTTALSGLTGTETFTVTIAKSGGDSVITMDLSEISGDKSVDSLIAYMNQKLADAGVYTRFTRTVVNGKTESDPKKYGLGVQTVATERVTLSAAATRAAVYIGGTTGTTAAQAGQLIKLDDQGSAAGSTHSKTISVKQGTADVRATATDSNGNVYVVGNVTEDLDGALVQGSQDVYLRKFDAMGQVVWSRLLGSSNQATGYAIATDANGNVAIGGRVSDKLTSTAVGGGQDSFVTKFDSEGREVFTRQVAPALDDQVNALAFDADGSLFVAGQTKAAMSGSVAHAGGSDAYVMKLTATGALSFVQQFGAADDDRATALTIDGSGNVFVGTVESGTGKVRKLAGSGDTYTQTWEMELGALGQGNVSALGLDGSHVYAAGSTTNAALDAGGQASIVSGHAGQSDGFVMKIADGGATATAQYTAYIGSAGNDSGLGLAVAGGAVYVSGSTDNSLTSSAAGESARGFVRKLASDGSVLWTHQYDATSGGASARSIAVDVQGSSVLDRLGLPRGQLKFDETRLITAGSSLRAGDHFYMSVNDGLKFKIKVDAGETMRSLVRKVNNVLLLKGEAQLSRAGGDGMKITAKEGNSIELIRGSNGFDALAGLGIEPIKLDKTAPSAKSKDAKKSFTLGMKAESSIADKTGSSIAAQQLSAAMDVIKEAYQALTASAQKPGSALDPRLAQSYKSLLSSLKF